MRILTATQRGWVCSLACLGPRTAGGAELALHISNACGERLIPRGRDPVRLGPTLEAVAHPLLVELDQALSEVSARHLLPFERLCARAVCSHRLLHHIGEPFELRPCRRTRDDGWSRSVRSPSDLQQEVRGPVPDRDQREAPPQSSQRRSNAARRPCPDPIVVKRLREDKVSPSMGFAIRQGSRGQGASSVLRALRTSKGSRRGAFPP